MQQVFFFVLVAACLPLLESSPLDSIFRGGKAVFSDKADPGEPLFLTPLIKNGQLQEAHQKSEVVPKVAGLTSYSGFLTVNESQNSNMFFWFFPAQSGKMSAPLMLWLQGGPGGSSLFGLFNENGPLVVDSKGMPSLRKVTWNTDYHMLYIDNPVGTGFSFSMPDGFATNEVEVGVNLYSALTQFFTVFKEYQASDFYLTGESYAGKYVPAIGFKIHSENLNNPKVRINLKGLAIGDGWCDPENMVNGYSPLIYQIGMADENQAAYILEETQKIVLNIKQNQYTAARQVWDELFDEYFFKISGSTNTYNFLRISEPPEFNYYIPFINTADTRGAIHVGNLSYGAQSGDVNKALGLDFMHSIKDQLSVLMDNYKVLIYNGQLDIVVGPTLSERFLGMLEWSGHEEYLKAERQVWKIGDDVAGYLRTVGRFVQAVVRGAGHILPYDQPERALNLIQHFVDME